LPPVSTTLAKLVAKFAAGVVDTGGKFAAGVKKLETITSFKDRDKLNVLKYPLKVVPEENRQQKKKDKNIKNSGTS
jgi:hypothetical protein